jgi:hypothetical protein
MVIKTVRMDIPILISRSGFTVWGVELARKANATLTGRARGKCFVAPAGESRIVFEQDLDFVGDESAGPGIQSHKNSSVCCPWIPGSLAALAPRNDNG